MPEKSRGYDYRNMDNRILPLADAVFSHARRGAASFHTPGHKGHAEPLELLSLLSHDLTELPDTGSLYDGGDVIEAAEKLAAAAFGAGKTLFSAGGCSLCIQTMLLLGAGAGAKVLMARNAHRSAVHAASLLGLDIVWCYPETSPNGSYSPVSASAINNILSSCNNIQAVYITSPDYYGNLCDVASIAAVCRLHGVPLLVDNAHGSHLGAFGRHPLQLGADMTADSAHKTLPVLTGGAFLHISKPFSPHISPQSAKNAMSLFGSTSPNYLILTSLDLARDWWEREGAESCRYAAEEVTNIKELVAGAAGLQVGFSHIDPSLKDPLRLTLETTDGADARYLAEHLRQSGCEPEMADSRYVVCILSPFNTSADWSRLRTAILTYPAAEKGHIRQAMPASFAATPPPFQPEQVLSPREALLRPHMEVPLRQCDGRIAAQTICPCPPGVAAVVPGERLTTEIIHWLLERRYQEMAVVCEP